MLHVFKLSECPVYPAILDAFELYAFTFDGHASMCFDWGFLAYYDSDGVFRSSSDGSEICDVRGAIAEALYCEHGISADYGLISWLSTFDDVPGVLYD